MAIQSEIAASVFDIGARAKRAALIGLLMLAAIVAAGSIAQAQTFTVLHGFSGPEGSQPNAGLTMDRAGNLYGTASLGGYTGGNCYNGCGTVFKLSQKNSAWVLTVLHAFMLSDGALPMARVVLGPDGSLYGTTNGGGPHQQGVVYRLQPSSTFCRAVQCPWTETIVYGFSGGVDGGAPGYGDLTFDSAGNIYGTTSEGGAFGQGTVFELTPANNGWTQKILYSFQGNGDASGPFSGVIFDAHGNLYGTTVLGGTDSYGTVYELTPSGSGWSESVLHSFTQFGDDGNQPYGGLTFDPSGNLYGATFMGGNRGSGTVYELTPSQNGWDFNVLYSFNSYEGAIGTMTVGPDGKLYGTQLDGNVDVFQLTPSGGGWSLTGFFGMSESFPFGNVIFGPSGNLFFTTAGSGGVGSGAVVEITP